MYVKIILFCEKNDLREIKTNQFLRDKYGRRPHLHAFSVLQLDWYTNG